MLIGAKETTAAPGAVDRLVLMRAVGMIVAPGALENSVRMNAADHSVVSGALERIVLLRALKKAAAIIALEIIVLLIALPMLPMIAVNLQCILQRHQKRQPNNEWANHAASTTTSISAKRATTQRFTRKPAKDCLIVT